LNTPEIITAEVIGAACYLATLGTGWKALRTLEARLRLVAPVKAPPKITVTAASQALLDDVKAAVTAPETAGDRQVPRAA
jgi:hypothetical protein